MFSVTVLISKDEKQITETKDIPNFKTKHKINLLSNISHFHLRSSVVQSFVWILWDVTESDFYPASLPSFTYLNSRRNFHLGYTTTVTTFYTPTYSSQSLSLTFFVETLTLFLSFFVDPSAFGTPFWWFFFLFY